MQYCHMQNQNHTAEVVSDHNTVCGTSTLQDWVVVRDVVNHEWRHPSLYNSDDMQPGQKRYLQPRFIQGCSFNFMQPAGQSRRLNYCSSGWLGLMQLPSLGHVPTLRQSHVAYLQHWGYRRFNRPLSQPA